MMKHPVSRDEIHNQCAKRQREEKRAAATRKGEEEISTLEDAVLKARKRREAREEFERRTRIPDCGGCAG